MKTRQKITTKELLLFFMPFPVLWLMLGLFIDSAVFTFWRTGQSISSLDAMALGFTPIVFSIIYIPAILIIRANGETLNLKNVTTCAVIAAFIGYILSPIP